MSKFQIRDVKSKLKHKVFTTDIDSAYKIIDLAKHLRNIKDKRVDVLINGKRVAYSTIVGRKKYAAGLELAAKISISTMDACLGKINKLTSEISRYKKLASEEKDKYKEAISSFSTSQAIIDIKQYEWQEKIADLKEACDLLYEENKRLKRELDDKSSNHKEPA